MAHYAQDCWDAEIFTTYKWIECVGIADRACYDLFVHSARSKVDLQANETFDTPREEEVARVVIDYGQLGRTFKDDSKRISEFLKGMDRTAVLKLKDQLAAAGETQLTLPGGTFRITSAMARCELVREKISSIRYTPSVIEPSFGIGRIMYALFEHSFNATEPNRTYLSIPAVVAPTKVAILPMSRSADFDRATAQLVKSLLSLNLASKVDNSTSSLGRKYARADEIGVPYAVTIDFDTLKDPTGSVTLRERDSKHQIRLPAEKAIELVAQLCTGLTRWQQAYDTFPRVVRDEKDEKE